MGGEYVDDGIAEAKVRGYVIYYLKLQAETICMPFDYKDLSDPELLDLLSTRERICSYSNYR